MINLVNTSLYSFNKTYDYQSVCDPEKDSKAAAGPRSVYVVSRGPSVPHPPLLPPSLLIVCRLVIHSGGSEIATQAVVFLMDVFFPSPHASRWNFPAADRGRPAQRRLVGIQRCLVSARPLVLARVLL